MNWITIQKMAKQSGYTVAPQIGHKIKPCRNAQALGIVVS